MPSIEGRCLCGGVRFRLDGPLSGISFCHCSRCRRASGGQPLGHVLVTARDLMWHAPPRLSHWEATSGYGRVFCASCGCPAPDRIFDGQAYRVPAGLLDTTTLTVAEHIYTGSPAPWCPASDQAPRYEGDGPPRTDLPWQSPTSS